MTRSSSASGDGGVPATTGLVRAPAWDEGPVALAEGTRVRAVSAAAGRLRIRAGMTVTEAKARCAGLVVLPWDDAAVAEEITRVTAAFLIASPQVSPAAGAPGTWWVGASGLEALGGERALARALVRIARTWHAGARVAIADSCVVARAATWSAPALPGAVVVVPPNGCAAYLTRVPLGLLPMDEELREALTALGLRTAGAFATLDAEEVERRWGESGLAAWRLAHGEDRRRPVLVRLDAPRAVAVDLATSAVTMEPVLFLVRSALDRLTRELVSDGRAAAVVAITLTLDDARGPMPTGGTPHTITREVRLPRPLARTLPLFERCRALLDQWTLSAPTCAVSVAITATAPLTGEQGELLEPAWRDPAAADAAFARLRAELGADAIVRPVPRDSHRPEHGGAWVAVEDGEEQERRAQRIERERGAMVGGMERSAQEPDREMELVVDTEDDVDVDVEMNSRLGAKMMISGARWRDRSAPTGGPPLLPAPRALLPGTSAPLSPIHPLALVRGAPPKGQDRTATPLGVHPSVSDQSESFPPPAAPAGASPASAGGTVPLTLVPTSVTATAGSHPAPARELRLTATLRQLERPDAVDVECVGDTPVRIRWRGRWTRIAHARGPERLSGDWWCDRYARDYWRCEEEGGRAELVLFRDRGRDSSGAWYLHGWYD